MAEPLFDGKLNAEERLELVARMMGHAGAHDAPKAFMEELLRKAERHAADWLRREISECARGERDRKMLGREAGPVPL